MRVRALLDGLDKVAPDGRREHVPKGRLPEADAARAHDGAAREHGVHKGKGRGHRALEKGLAEAAQPTVPRVVEPTRHASARGALVPRRVGTVVRDAVPEPTHRLAHGRGLRVPSAVEPLDPRRVPAHRLRVRDTRTPRLEPSRDHVAQSRGLVEDRVPVAHEIVDPAERVRLGQLEDARRGLGRQEALMELSLGPRIEPLGLSRLEVVVDLVWVHGSLGERATTTMTTI